MNLKYVCLDEIKLFIVVDLFLFIEMGVEECDKMVVFFEEYKFDRVVYLVV